MNCLHPLCCCCWSSHLESLGSVLRSLLKRIHQNASCWKLTFCYHISLLCKPSSSWINSGCVNPFGAADWIHYLQLRSEFSLQCLCPPYSKRSLILLVLAFDGLYFYLLPASDPVWKKPAKNQQSISHRWHSQWIAISTAYYRVSWTRLTLLSP